MSDGKIEGKGEGSPDPNQQDGAALITVPEVAQLLATGWVDRIIRYGGIPVVVAAVPLAATGHGTTAVWLAAAVLVVVGLLALVQGRRLRRLKRTANRAVVRAMAAEGAKPQSPLEFTGLEGTFTATHADGESRFWQLTYVDPGAGLIRLEPMTSKPPTPGLPS